MKALERHGLLEREPKTEQAIREELNHLSTYRVPNSTTDLVSLKAVERVLNLVFRGHRDKEPKTGHWIMHLDDLFPLESTQECSICHARQSISIADDNYCPNCGCRMESEGGDFEE